MHLRPTLLLLALLLAAFPGMSQRLLVPDSSFNAYGYVRQPSMLRGQIHVYDNGGFLAAGCTETSFAVWKYLPGGGRDASFGQNGTAEVTLPGGISAFNVSGVCVQPDGRIVLLGGGVTNSMNLNLTTGRIVLLRFMPDGRPDTSFNGTGYVLHKPLSNYEYRTSCLAVDTMTSDYRYYVASYVSPAGGWGGPDQWCISKYKSNGRADSSFNGTGYLQAGGQAINAGTASLAIVRDMKVLPDRRLLAAGNHQGSDKAWFMFRMKPGGTYDSTFGTNGRILRPTSFISAANDFGSAHILQDNSVAFLSQEIYYGFPAAANDSTEVHVARQRSNGTPDMGYGVNGELHYSYRGSGLHQQAFDSAGRMLLCWYRNAVVINQSRQEIVFARINAAGAPDTSFGTGNGRMVTEPILNDQWVNRAGIGHVAFSKDYNKVHLLGSYSTAAVQTGTSLFRYRFVKDQLPAGIGSQQAGSAIVAYPIPATGRLYVQAGSGPAISAYALGDITGKVLRQQSGLRDRELAIPLDALAPGQYLLRIHTADGAASSRKVTIR